MITSRVALDTNYYRGAPIAALAALRNRGFKLSISFIAFMEHTTRSARENTLAKLVNRARKLKDLIDPRVPLLPTGQQLVGLVGAKYVDGRPTRHEEVMEFGKGAWEHLSGDDPVDMGWLAQGRVAGDEAMGQNLANWRALHDIEPWMDSFLKVGTEGEVARALAQGIARELATASNFDQRRWDAFHQTTALRIVRARRRPLAQRRRNDNDAEDVQLLQHLGIPAILATRDLDLIRTVDATGTFQAPWVRTIGELLDGPIPHGEPWGRRAEKQAATFRRPEQLAKHEERILAGLEKKSVQE